MGRLNDRRFYFILAIAIYLMSIGLAIVLFCVGLVFSNITFILLPYYFAGGFIGGLTGTCVLVWLSTQLNE